MIRAQLIVNICTEADVAYVQIFGKRRLCAVNNTTYRNVILFILLMPQNTRNLMSIRTLITVLGV